MGSPEGAKLSVWVCQEEKVVCGLTKRTSCAQVVRALLRDHLAHAGDTRLLHAPARDYCLAEKWRGFERLLPPATKLLRLWLSWGSERRNVRFVLVKWDARLPLPGLRSAEAKVVPSSSGEGQRGERRPAGRSVRDLPRDKQRRMVRKAFRKLAKMKKLRQGRERMETLVHLIVSQDHTIRQQLSRLRELDGDIERFEGRLHSERVQSDGQNYVQETYLLEGGPLQEYLERSEAVYRLEEDLERHREAVRRLSEELELEREQLLGGGGGDNSGPERLEEEEEGSSDRLPGELERTACRARQLSRSLADVQRRLQQQEAALHEKAEEYERLARQLEHLSLAEEADGGGGGGEAPGPCQISTKGSVTSPPESGFALSEVNDTDSDTGISSTHSQDSESPCVVLTSKVSLLKLYRLNTKHQLC
ncbi:ras association domain-containing protein 9-like [Stegostoma tigrinum]|uniref:ras association domain-containing protein 9-like n=1 Tax=Stegostoma tigrinum TaxID=3053191 RepID=UPI00202B69A1|nr:ras association domain-containing protein 9-like [Stegostoma tigrinum]XP_048404996.1 ras association domain-containing protein 9-like [Stegostoma tigrinum]XP_059508451.1 ras association domain-containing protein 9-like [Stegostoma tigrinum]XP_059508452.1 ras association domain-containing protein 9-like [Stegostoma tigrinum]